MIDVRTLTCLLWPEGNGPEALQVYALLDGARDEAIAPAIWRSQLPYECLYAGSLSPALRMAAPYLAHLAPESAFFSRLVSDGWARAWGLFVIAQPDVTFQALRKHFRTLLRVKDEQKRVLVFRFYDPRILRVYLPTCTGAELSLFFGPVRAFACESEAGNELIRHERNEMLFGGLSSTVQQVLEEPAPQVPTEVLAAGGVPVAAGLSRNEPVV
jgi:hypothetical protein